MGEQATQVAVADLGDPTQASALAAGMLAWDQAKPGGQIVGMVWTPLFSTFATPPRVAKERGKSIPLLNSDPPTSGENLSVVVLLIGIVTFRFVPGTRRSG